MITKIYQPILITTLLLGATIMSSHVFAVNEQSQEVIDARQEAQIWTTYALSPYLRTNKLTVLVHGGKATLTGVVADDIDKDLAKQIALGVEGIDNVDNQITIDENYKPSKNATQEKSYGQLIDDVSITSVIKSKLLWSKKSDGLATHVNTQFGKVTLKGVVENEASKVLAGRLAKNTRGVDSVDNLLTVKDESKSAKLDNSKKSANSIGDKVSDTWITTKVKSTFIYSSNVESADISVSTKDGVVILSGKVNSGTERELAIELAQNIRGVKSVQSIDLIF